MAAQTDDKKLDGAGLTTLWGIIKQYIADNPSIPKATVSVLGGIMVGTTLAIDNSGVLNLASGVVAAGTYKSVTVDTYGRVTAGTNPNTLAGYGITDAKISNGSIILGENSITPITSLSGYATQMWVQNQGYLTEETYKGTVTQVKVGTTAYNPTSGVVSLPAYPTTLPASDVSAWAKAATKPSYTASEVGAATSDHTHTTSIAESTGTNQLTLAHGGKYSITAGNTSYVFTMPSGYSLPTASSSTLGGVKVGTTLAISSGVLNLATSGVTAGTYKRVTVDSYGRVTAGDNTDADTNTWRNIYVAGTEKVGTGISTKALNFVAGSNVTISYAAAGTGDGQSGNANYFNIKIAATDTTYSAATQSAAGLMSAADKKKLDGVAAGANAYSLPLAASGTRGGVKIGYTQSGKNYPVQLSSEQMYVNVPWTDTTYSVFTASANGLAPMASSDNKTTAESSVGNYYLCADGKYRQLPANAFKNDNTNTWRNVYTGGTSRVGTGTSTKAINFVAGSNVTVTYEAAGTSSGQSGSADYFNVKIAATDTTYSAATQSAAGLMSAADKKKLDGIAASANNYSLPTASSSTLGGIKVGASVTGKNYAVQLDSSNCAYVYVPWTDNNTDVNVKVNATNPTSGTWYYPVWYTATSGTGNVNANDGFRYYSLEGTKSALGESYVQIGNSTASGTAGNKRGHLRIYGNKAYYGQFDMVADLTANKTYTFSADGTVLTSGNSSVSLSGSTLTVKINGVEKSLTNTNSTYPKAVKNITRSGTTFTATCYDDTTFTFTQQDNNTTYSQASLGQVYAYSTPPTSGTAVTATNSDYVLATGGILAVQFDTNPVPASATLNVNSKGAKNIKYKKAALAAGVIKAGDLATFMYDGTQYELLTVDRTMKAVTDISRNGTTFTATCVDGSTFTFTQQDNNTTYTLAGLMGSSAKGGTTQPIYWNGSAFKNTTYTLGKSVPSDAVFTDTNTWRTVQCNGTSIGNNTLNLKAGTNVSLSNSNGTITIKSTDTNTWRGIQNNLTSTSTSDSLSANQGRLLANGSARDSTKLPLSGGALTGNVSLSVSNAAVQVNCPDVGSIALHAATSGNRGLYDEGWVISTNGTNTYLEKGGVYAPNGFYAGSLSGTGIQIARYDGTPHDDVIERYGGAIWLQYYSGNNVAIGQASSTYKLNVAGTCGATGFTNTSDIRKKNIIKDGLLVRLNDIVNAPLFDFTWKDVNLDKDLHIGSSAQYWKNVIPEAVSVAKDEIGTLSMQYDVIALASCVSVAKETLTLKEKVALLETHVESLEKKIREYESN